MINKDTAIVPALWVLSLLAVGTLLAVTFTATPKTKLNLTEIIPELQLDPLVRDNRAFDQFITPVRFGSDPHCTLVSDMGDRASFTGNMTFVDSVPEFRIEHNARKTVSYVLEGPYIVVGGTVLVNMPQDKWEKLLKDRPGLIAGGADDPRSLTLVYEVPDREEVEE